MPGYSERTLYVTGHGDMMPFIRHTCVRYGITILVHYLTRDILR